MAVNLSPIWGAGAQLLDNSGNVLTGGKIYTYAAGTTTPATTYTSSNGNTANSNPIILNSAGRVPYEIWLTDSIEYKFVLKDSNDTLIGTWDNLIGINSNFVNFTNQQEIQTATSNQTVFNLVGMEYSPGTNSLTVFVDGVNQYGPGAQYAYVETDSNTVTFVSGLHEGASVKFTTSQLNSSSGVDAEQVGYTPPYTDSVPTNVELKLAQTVSFKDFGAIGDGGTDDTVAVQAAIDSGAYVIDGQGLTYLITAKLTGITSETKIQNAVFDFSSYSTSGNLIEFGGTLGTPTALTSNTLVNSASVNVGSTTGFAANDLIFITSNAVWDSGTSTTFGQYARVKSVDSSTQLTLFSNVNLSFNTANSAAIAKVTPVKNVTFENVQIIGSGANEQIGIYLSYGEKCNFVRCRLTNIDYTALGLWRCYESTIDSCRQEFAAYSGTAYAYGIWGGCYSCTVINSWGEDNRHTVTVGDNDGINMYTRVIGCHAISSKDAGFDTHSAAMFTLFMGNNVEMSAAQFLTSNHDGMISEGCHTSFIGNTVNGQKGVGIFVQPRYTATGYPSTDIITGNKVVCDDVGYGAVSGSGIYALANNDGADIDSVIIKDNVISGGANNSSGITGIYVYALKASSTIKNAHIEGNTVLAPSGNVLPIYVRAAAANATVKNVTIKNNTIEATNAWAIQLNTSNASATVKDVSIGGNTIYSASGNGIFFNNDAGTISNIRVDKNVYDIGGTKTIENDGGASIIIDDYEYASAQDFTTSTPSIGVTSTTNWFTFSAGATQTVTLPSAANSVGRMLHFLSYQNNTVVSASSNVIPAAGGAAGTAILPATAGSWADLRSNGTNWVIVRKG